jgi:flagellar hook assembly protein FlgD
VPPLLNYSPAGANFSTGVDEPNIIYHHQVSPNPVQDATSISFFLTTYQPNFSMKIYDAEGSLVKVVSEGAMTAGDKKVTWNKTNTAGEKVAAGVYYFVMQSRNSNVTDKLIVVD